MALASSPCRYLHGEYFKVIAQASPYACSCITTDKDLFCYGEIAKAQAEEREKKKKREKRKEGTTSFVSTIGLVRTCSPYLDAGIDGEP